MAKSGQLGTFSQSGMFAGGMAVPGNATTVPFSGLTGTPGDNAALVSYVGAAKLTQPIATVIATGALNAAQYTVLVDATSGASVQTLPTAASSSGKVFVIKKIDASANTVTIQGNGAELIDGVNTKVISTQWTAVMLQSNGTAWYILSNN